MGTDVVFTTTYKDEDDKYKVCILFINNEDKFDKTYNFRGGRYNISDNKLRLSKESKRITRKKYIITSNMSLIDKFKNIEQFSPERHTLDSISLLCIVYYQIWTSGNKLNNKYKINNSAVCNYIASISGSYNNLIKQIHNIINYYNDIDIELANCIKSVVCLIELIRIYEVDLGESFGEYHPKIIMRHATPEILKELEQYPASMKPEKMWKLLNDDRFNQKKYTAIYEEVNHCAAWDIDDYNRIMMYIIDNNLDVYTTLQQLAGPYGIQTTVKSILEFSQFPYENRKSNTPEMKALVDTIHALPRNDNMKGWKYIKGRVEDYLQATFKKRLIWEAKFW